MPLGCRARRRDRDRASGRVGSPGRVILAGREKDLILPKNLTGEVGQRGAELNPGDPAPDGGGQLVPVAVGKLVEQRDAHHPQARDIRPDPFRPVHHGDRGGRTGRFQPGVCLDMVFRLDSQPSQLRNHRVRFGAGQGRAGPDKPARCRYREIPVD